MLDTRNNFLAQLSIPEILQFGRHSHCNAILIKNLLSLSLCKPVKAARDAALKWTFEHLIHNSG